MLDHRVAMSQQQQDLSRFGLGTAQFGMLYGTFNREGVPSRVAVGAIMNRAHALGLSVIDTACQYGESECVLGQFPDELARFDVVTKTPTFADGPITSADAQALREAFFMSLEHMKLPAVGGLLVHHAPNLLAPGGELLYEELVRIKDEGRVRRIGVSAYSGEIVERILEKFPVDLVQLPINVLDRRLFQDGTLTRLAHRGIEIHARSAFLQGLLLADPMTLPGHFDCVRGTLMAFQKAAREVGVSPAHAALLFLLRIREVSRVVVGVESVAQLEDLFGQFPDDPGMEYTAFATGDAHILNPGLWEKSMVVGGVA